MVSKFFDTVKKAYDRYGVNSPDNIFNFDETGLILIGGKLKIVTRRGIRNLNKITNDNSQKQVTISACCNANGTFVFTNVKKISWAFEIKNKMGKKTSFTFCFSHTLFKAKAYEVVSF